MQSSPRLATFASGVASVGTGDQPPLQADPTGQAAQPTRRDGPAESNLAPAGGSRRHGARSSGLVGRADPARPARTPTSLPARRRGRQGNANPTQTPCRREPEEDEDPRRRRRQRNNRLPDITATSTRLPRPAENPRTTPIRPTHALQQRRSAAPSPRAERARDSKKAAELRQSGAFVQTLAKRLNARTHGPRAGRAAAPPLQLIPISKRNMEREAARAA